jgi:hypothetical protein
MKIVLFVSQKFIKDYSPLIVKPFKLNGLSLNTEVGFDQREIFANS